MGLDNRGCDSDLPKHPRFRRELTAANISPVRVARQFAQQCTGVEPDSFEGNLVTLHTASLADMGALPSPGSLGLPHSPLPMRHANFGSSRSFHGGSPKAEPGWPGSRGRRDEVTERFSMGCPASANLAGGRAHAWYSNLSRV